MNWISIGVPVATIVCLIGSALSLKRGLQLKRWIPMKGKVIGPATHLDTSAVKIEFIDPAGIKRNFESNIRFGHSYYAKPNKRLPFKQDQEIKILVNPTDYNDAEINTSMYLWISLAMILAFFYCGYHLLSK